MKYIRITARPDGYFDVVCDQRELCYAASQLRATDVVATAMNAEPDEVRGFLTALARQ